MLEAGFAEAVITPPRGVDLAGYFHIRANRGVLDDLYVRVALFRSGAEIGGIVVFDLSFIPEDLFAGTKRALRAAGMDFADKLIFSATHTHTGTRFHGPAGDLPEEVERVSSLAADAIERAFADLAPAELAYAAVEDNPHAFVRRFWMKSGGVATNPGVGNPDIIRPESDPDRLVQVLAVRREGRLAGMVVNLANHGDTIGGYLVSADWPGRMVAEIRHQLGGDVMVLPLISAAGDINHVNVCAVPETGGVGFLGSKYSRALEIGRCCGRIAGRLLERLEPLTISSFTVSRSEIDVARLVPGEAELADAERTLREISPELKIGDGFRFTDPAVQRYFAQRVVDCAGNAGKTCRIGLVALKFDRELAVTNLPGECFHAVATTIRARSPFRHTLVSGLSPEASCYIPLTESFERGGYETLSEPGKLERGAADRLIFAAVANLNDGGENV